MSTSTNTLLWSNAVDHCMNHITQVTNLNKVIRLLQDIDVESVVPIISSHNATLLITPNGAANADIVRVFLQRVEAAVGIHNWKTVRMGDYWMIKGSNSEGIMIDVATRVPNSKPEEFSL